MGRLAWMLGTLLKSSERALFALISWAISLAPAFPFFIVSVLIISIAFAPSHVSTAFSKEFPKRPASILHPLRIRALTQILERHVTETKEFH